MKSFNSYEELLESIGMDKNNQYADDLLTNYLGCEGSCDGENGKEPNIVFMLEHEGIKYEIGVTHEEIEEDKYKYTYWID